MDPTIPSHSQIIIQDHQYFPLDAVYSREKEEEEEDIYIQNEELGAPQIPLKRMKTDEDRPHSTHQDIHSATSPLVKNDELVPVVMIKTKKNVFECPICKCQMSTRQALWKHKKRKHPGITTEENRNKNSLQCMDCEFRCPRVMDLIKHYEAQHDRRFLLQTQDFASEVEFLNWKEEEERTTKASFVQHCGPRQRENAIVQYFYCNRSGYFIAKGEGKRNIKRQGSSKIGATCPAFIKFVLSRVTGRGSAEYCLEHTHPCEFAHLRLSDAMQRRVASHLTKGVKIEEILDDVRCNAQASDRDSYIVRKDVQNIKHRLNRLDVNAEDRQSDNTNKITLLVQEMSSQKFNPILYYKGQGIESDVHEANDILIGIQTEFQKDMFLKYGKNCVCIDSLHETSQYDYFLIIIMVIDGMGEILPAAWLVSNKEDSCAITAFFHALKDRIVFVNIRGRSLHPHPNPTDLPHLIWATTMQLESCKTVSNQLSHSCNILGR
ncbi:hypothetical protein Pcinc_037136 [Petrolisthes cinctipes]|uniref:C2H2-type domain-containing protein n=1 Tax=Petrolisthes cinctipes TaxID=88211 RepID=A0AAE1ELW9_PETCI|nr:hypothetical protein Pcinc_037136 [Petrolisthes cinctipes]